MKEIKKILSGQINFNKQKNLLYQNIEELMGTNQSFLKKLEEIKKNNEFDYYDDNLESLIDFTVNELVKEVYRINQFLNITDSKIEEVKKIYRNSWEMLKNSGNIKSYLYKYHYSSLSEWLSDLYPPEFRKYLANQKEIGSVVCEEYSPEFQMKILRLDVGNILQPVIDIGCGKNGKLVEYLRQHDIDIIGLDRIIEKQMEYFIKNDWLKYKFKSESWGTIISNAALSNHIIYSAECEPEKLELYKKKYFEILESLKIGGEFIYAPGIPFIEKELDKDKFGISKYLITGEYYLSKIKKIN